MENFRTEVAGQSFVIEIKCVKNQTWQGIVTWVEKQERIPFRSALELIKLIDSAVRTHRGEESLGEWKC
ncbi:MAG: hypothetical protein RR275_00130 [Lachnospiraceae bacterium]